MFWCQNQKKTHQTGGFPGQAPTSGNTQAEPTQKQFVNPEMEPLTGRDDNDGNAQQAVQQLQAQADESNVILIPHRTTVNLLAYFHHTPSNVYSN